MEIDVDHVGGVDSHQVKHATSGRRHHGVLSSEEPFMASLGRGGMVVKAGAWRDPVPAILLLALCSDWKTTMAEGVEPTMADRTHPVQECRCAGLIHGRNVGGRGGARPDLKGEDLGEN